MIKIYCLSPKNQSSIDLNENAAYHKPCNIFWQRLPRPYGIHFVTEQKKTGHACVFMLWLQTVCNSRACTVSVVVPDISSLFFPELNLKQGLLSDFEGYMFASIKTMLLMDKDVNIRILYLMQQSSGKMAPHSLIVNENTYKSRVCFNLCLTMTGPTDHTSFFWLYTFTASHFQTC